MPDNDIKKLDPERLAGAISNLQVRIERIEHALNLQPLQIEEDGVNRDEPGAADYPRENLELKIGLYWFAKVGVVALITGVVFLLLQPFGKLHPVFAPVLGYALAGGVLLVSKLLRKSSPFLSGYLLGGGLLLLFFGSLRLHYFTQHPALGPGLVETILLLVVVITSLGVSIRRMSIYLVSLSLTMCFVTALLSEQPYSFFALCVAAAGLACYLAVKHDWGQLLLFGMTATYITNLVWFLNNPLVGNQLALRTIPYFLSIMLLLWPVIFSLGTFFRRMEEEEPVNVIINSLLNVALGYGLFLLVAATEFQSRLAASDVLGSFIFLSLATVFWLRGKSKFQTFFYAMTGYAALSVAIIAGFGLPNLFILLCWQSLLVVSMATWFRSKFIVLANFIIYSIIFFAFLFLAESIGITSLSFGVVALLSARILNWQQKRLELKTDKMRIAYLVAAFFIFPFSLYHIVPSNYVSLSWLAVALVYYMISLLLKNMKYRWMALLTFLLSAFYLIIIGITKLEPVFRILSFLILGIVLLAISFIYARTRMKSGS